MPAVAAEHDSPLTKNYLSKARLGRIIQVRTEIQLERMRLMDKKWKLLEDKKVLWASTEATLPAQLNGKR